MIDISNRRECFFDDYLIDKEKTSADFRVHQPVRRDVVMSHTMPWEGNCTDYHNMFYDNGIWRMYYVGWDFPSTHGLCFCYAESRDGIHWTRPNLGICEWEGSRENNIIFDRETLRSRDNFMVFRDDNPACPAEKKYKAILSQEKHTLWYFYSDDGVHFHRGEMLTDKGAFDSLNVAFWDDHAKKYRCFYRAAHAEGAIQHPNILFSVCPVRFAVC